MKENSYLAHYGRKGMKWGKHIFGRVPGIPGGPEVSEYETGRIKEMVDSAKAADANIKKVQNYVLAATNRNLSDTTINTMYNDPIFKMAINKGRDGTKTLANYRASDLVTRVGHRYREKKGIPKLKTNHYGVPTAPLSALQNYRRDQYDFYLRNKGYNNRQSHLYN